MRSRSTDQQATGDDASVTAAVDAAIEALADGERRRVLSSLSEADGRVPIERLAADVRSDTDGPSPGREGRGAVRLHHLHLPKLADAGLVEYDPGEGTAEVADAGWAIELAAEVIGP